MPAASGGTPYVMRCRVLIGMLVLSTSAYAQPLDPYAPAKPAQPPAPAPAPAPSKAPAPAPTPAPMPPGDAPQSPTPPPGDPVLAEQVAQALVMRAQELYDAKVYVDAKQLAVEALVRNPRGTAADQARVLIKAINQQLGIKDEPTEPKVDLTPIQDPAEGKDKIPPQPEGPQRPSRLTAGVHSALYAGLIGATIGSFFDDDQPAAGAVPVGIATGLAAGAFVPRVFDRIHWNDAQVRTLGAATVWGGMVGGLFGDIGKTQDTSGRQVLVSASVGATLGGAAGFWLARQDKFTTGDIALIDTLAGIGAVGGFSVGLLMQPVETEAFSLNSVFGIAGGVVVGMIAAPQTNTTSRRMLRVAGISAAAGGLPFLLYAGIHDPGTTADERITGLLSSIGLVGGAWLGFRLTRNIDREKDVQPNKHKPEDNPPLALVSRDSQGWTLGTLTLQPLSRQLAPQRGFAVPLVGASW